MTGAIKIVGFAGSASRPSRTRNLVESLAEAAAKRCNASFSVHDLTEVRYSLGSTLDPREAPKDLHALISEITSADALVLGSPVYKGTYSGLFKHLFDLLDPDALRGKPVVLTATGGSDRHALILDYGLRPLLSFFGADTLPTAIFATEADFSGYAIDASHLIARVARAVDELESRLLGGRREDLSPLLRRTA